MFFLFSSPLPADPWTRTDTYHQGAFLTVLAVDWLQTKEINGTDGVCELNPVLGKHPRQNTIDLYFAGCALGHTAIAYHLPQPYRKWWQYVWIGAEVGTIGHNYHAGIRIRF